MSDLKAKLAEINDERAQLEKDAQTKWAKVEETRETFAKSGADSNDTESEEFKAALAANKEHGEVAEKLADLDKVRDGVFAMISNGSPRSEEAKSVRQDQDREVKALADRVIEAPEYKQLLDSGVLSSERASFNVKLADIGLREAKALITGLSDTSGGAFVTNDVKPYVQQPIRPRSILDLVTVGQTNSDTVEYVRQGTYTNASAFVAEATTSDTGTKPEATIPFAKVTETVKNIAVLAATTRRALADAGQLKTLIESQLSEDIRTSLEVQIVNGSGSGENLTGILNTSNILSQPKGSDSVADAVHKAITQIRLGFIEPNGVAMHPNDWQVVRLSRDDSGASAGTGGYLFGPPSTAGAEQIWGLNVAVTAAQPDDTALVGDFRRAVLWVREGTQLFATDSHSDWFYKNLIALLAEMRAAFGVLLPQAFCKVTSVD